MNLTFFSAAFNKPLVKNANQPKFGVSTPYIIDVDESNFEREVIQASKYQPVLVKFYADWCPPCQKYAPEFAKHAESSAYQIKSAQFNAGPKSTSGKLKVSRTMAKYGVFNIPTTILFKDGEPVERFLGAHSQAEVEEKMAPHMVSDAL